MDMHRLETVLFSNGERFPLLVNVKTGIPDFYSTLWVTVELRNQSAVNTIRNKLGTIQWIMNWEKLLSPASHYLRLKLPEIGNIAILCHYPLYEWDGIHHGLYHLYGHLHDRMAAVKGRALNVGWDMHGRFLTAQDIDSFLRDLPAVQYFDDKQNVIVGNSTEDAAAKVQARLAALNQ